MLLFSDKETGDFITIGTFGDFISLEMLELTVASVQNSLKNYIDHWMPNVPEPIIAHFYEKMFWKT